MDGEIALQCIDIIQAGIYGNGFVMQLQIARIPLSRKAGTGLAQPLAFRFLYADADSARLADKHGIAGISTNVSLLSFKNNITHSGILLRLSLKLNASRVNTT